MVCAFCAFYIWVFLIVSTGFSPPEIGYFNRLHSNVVFVVGNWAGFKRWSIACSAGVFVLELAVVSSPPYWLSAQLPLPGTRFCLSPSLFRVWIQDGARLIKLAASLAKIRLHCRLGGRRPPILFTTSKVVFHTASDETMTGTLIEVSTLFNWHY